MLYLSALEMLIMYRRYTNRHYLYVYL